jgi:hypothetical protein
MLRTGCRAPRRRDEVERDDADRRCRRLVGRRARQGQIGCSACAMLAVMIRPPRGHTPLQRSVTRQSCPLLERAAAASAAPRERSRRLKLGDPPRGLIRRWRPQLGAAARAVPQRFGIAATEKAPSWTRHAPSAAAGSAAGRPARAPRHRRRRRGVRRHRRRWRVGARRRAAGEAGAGSAGFSVPWRGSPRRPRARGGDRGETATVGIGARHAAEAARAAGPVPAVRSSRGGERGRARGIGLDRIRSARRRGAAGGLHERDALVHLGQRPRAACGRPAALGSRSAAHRRDPVLRERRSPLKCAMPSRYCERGRRGARPRRGHRARRASRAAVLEQHQPVGVGGLERARRAAARA